MVLSPDAVPGERLPPVHRTALWVTPVAGTGGVARHVLDAVRGGIPGWRVVVLCPEGALADALRAAGHPVLTGPVAPEDGTRTAVGAIRGALRRLGPDVLHTHLAFSDLAGVAAVAGVRSARGERVRVVSTEHGISGVRGLYQSTALAARGRRAAHRARLHRTDLVIAVSASTRAQIHAQWGTAAPVRVIRNGVERPGAAGNGPDLWRDTIPAGATSLRVLSLSRLAPEKGIDHTLRAFARVLAADPAARLTVAGEGPLRAELETLAAQLGIDGAVTFPGHLDPGGALAVHDVVVQLSAWENLSYTLLDAVAAQRGVVASPVGGNGEIVPGRCLVDPADPQAVAAVILTQGRDAGARPDAAPVGGSVADMTAAIAAAYEGTVTTR